MMAKTAPKPRTRIPSDPERLAEWLAPRPYETYDQWSRRFDRAERRLVDLFEINYEHQRRVRRNRRRLATRPVA